MKDIGPDAVPDEVLTSDPDGLSLVKENPVPPPVL
jgi:hypothetical protein